MRQQIDYREAQPQTNLQWSKEILAKEIIKVLPEFQVSDIIKKRERVHRWKESELSEILAIVATFTTGDS